MENKFAIAVKCLLKNEDDKYLILKKTQEENKKDANSNLYDIPGGRIEYGENVLDALIREIFEETGISITLNNIRCYICYKKRRLISCYYYILS